MIRLNKLTDYAVVMMSELAREGAGASRSASYLAARTTISEPTVAKILKLLTKEGLMESARGAGGGYKLARAPESITVAEVVTALEGPIAIVSCVEGGEGCPMQHSCSQKSNWEPVNKAIRAVLENISLVDIGVRYPAEKAA